MSYAGETCSSRIESPSIIKADLREGMLPHGKENFEKKDFSGMEKEYKKIEKQLNNIAPIEKTINEAKTIMTLHNLIKNNGQNFNLSKEQLELAEKLK